MIANPGEPTSQPSTPFSPCRTDWHVAYLLSASRIAFWLGTILFVLGSLISFFPGAEANWFAVSAALVGLGFFVPSKGYRIAALVIAAICLFWIWTGYQGGAEYHEWLQNRRE